MPYEGEFRQAETKIIFKRVGRREKNGMENMNYG